MTGPPKIKRGPAFVGQLIPPLTPKARATAAGTYGKGLYKPLPKEFRRDGFHFRQIAREGDAAIYEQTWNGCRDPSIAYEVIRIRRREGFEIGGKFVPSAELYPRSEQWGELGWTFCNKETAFAKLREICG